MSTIEGRITVTIRYFFDQTGERDEKTRKNIVKMVLPSLSADEKPLEMIPISNILKSLERDGVFLSDLQSIRYFDAVDEGFLRIDLGDEEGFGQSGLDPEPIPLSSLIFDSTRNQRILELSLCKRAPSTLTSSSSSSSLSSFPSPTISTSTTPTAITPTSQSHQTSLIQKRLSTSTPQLTFDPVVATLPKSSTFPPVASSSAPSSPGAPSSPEKARSSDRLQKVDSLIIDSREALENFETSNSEKELERRLKGRRNQPRKRAGGRTFVCGRYLDGRVISTPSLVGSLENIPIVEIVGAENHFIALTQAGKVYTWGNGELGKLGHGSPLSVSKPQLLLSLSEVSIISISAGQNSSGAVSDSGEVYVWGQTCLSNDLIPTNVMTPRRLDNLPEKKFVQVSCGEFHNAAMTNEGEVWTWGWERAYAHPPTLIEKLGGAAVDICSARDHTCILTAHQEVYTLVLKQKRLQIPASLSQLADLLGDTHLNSCRESGLYKENVPPSAVQIASNVNTLLVRLEGGQLILVDLTSSNGESNAEHLPQFSVDPLVDLGCGFNHLAAISSSGTLYTWGYGGFGALGHGNTEYKRVGAFVNGLEQSYLQRVVCTSFCTFVIDDPWTAMFFKTMTGDMTVTPKLLDHLLTATKEQLETSIKMAHKRYIQHIQKTGFLGFLLRGRQPSVELSKVALDFNLLDRCPLRRKLIEKFSIINTGGSDIHVALNLKCATNTFSLKIDHQSALIPPGGKKEFEASLIALYPTEINAALIFTINEHYHQFIVVKVSTESVVTSDLEINFQEIELGKQISESQYPVYRARWHGVAVAVKVFSYHYIEDLFNTFKKEVEIMSTIRHPNILSLLGACTSPLCIVMELMAGSIYDRVHDLKLPLDLPTVLKWSLETAVGMNYLHSRGIIHRDLKSPNLLVSYSNQVKVCDFGQSRYLSTKMTTRVGTILWMAPEVLRGEAYCLSSDVYSFGVVLWEMIARKLPYDELPSSEQIFHEVTAKHARPTIPPHANPDLKNLMLACWHPNPEKRPSFGYIIENLEEITKGQA